MPTHKPGISEPFLSFAVTSGGGTLIVLVTLFGRIPANFLTLRTA